MPLFGNKFSPKKTPHRKNCVLTSEVVLDDLVSENRVIRVKLGDQECLFQDGNWIPVSGENSNVYSSNQKLRQKINELQEENNLLKVKYEILLNMLTQSTAESHLQQREIDKLRKLDNIKTKK